MESLGDEKSQEKRKVKQPKVAVVGPKIFEDLNQTVAQDTKLVEVGNAGVATGDPKITSPNMHRPEET